MPSAGSVLRTVGMAALAAVLATMPADLSYGATRDGAAPPAAAAQAAPGAAVEGRDWAVDIIAKGRRIATPEGIETLEAVDVGGDRQWLSIRGRNRANPVLLVIHGGPGTPIMPLNWVYQSPWEDFFTVVNWDQRGVGKNAATADHERLSPTVSLDQIVNDAVTVIDHVRRTLNKEKVAVLGFSWGAIVGTHLAARHPDRVSVYVGVGQPIALAFEELIRNETLAAAERAGDQAAVAELKSLDLKPSADGRFPMDQVVALRRILRRYDGMWYGHGSLEIMNQLAALSPDYTAGDVATFQAGSAWLGQTRIMRDLVANDLREIDELRVPVVLLLGRYDLATPYGPAKDWLDSLKAPSKRLVTFERSSHFVMLEEPGRFLMALVNDVLPLTEGSPAYAAVPRSKARY